MQRVSDEESVATSAVGSQMCASFVPVKSECEVCASYLQNCCVSCEQPLLFLSELWKSLLHYFSYKIPLCILKVGVHLFCICRLSEI